VPPLHELAAPPQWQSIEFVSDLHLSESTPATWQAFRHHLLHTDAHAVLLLGDIFEVWIGDDSAQSGFDLQCAQLLQAAARRLTCGFMVGNRDFLVGPGFLEACGLMPLPDPTVLSAFGSRVLLTHGDALCLGDADYQRFRAQVRSTSWREQFLAQPIEQRRLQARRMRDASEQRKRSVTAPGYADVDDGAAEAWLQAAGTRLMVHGHTHRPASGPIGQHGTRHVLSDWDLDDPAQPRAQVLRLTPAGFQRLDPIRPPVPPA
jgi:UDP-2,3-diacylglucosamine hydrolase